MAFRDLLLTLGLAVSAGCGGDNHTCGSGTTLVGQMCLGSGGVTCGMGTSLVDGMCVGSAGTTCGSGTTLVNGACVGDSSCGPGTVLTSGVCVVDTSAPSPVTGLAATAAASSVGLSWTAGTGSTESLVVRLVAGAYDAPAPFTAYTAGQTLPGGATVIASGTATSVTDMATTPGRYSYLVWSRNASGTYGFPREVSAMVALPAQTGTIAIDVAAATATVSAQPANVVLAGANVTYNQNTSELTFDLSATQNTAGHLFNLKAVFGTPSTGVVSGVGSTAAGDPFYTFGVGAIPPAVKLTTSVTIANINPTDTVTLPVTLQESGLAIVGSNAVDMAGGPAFAMTLPQLRGRGNSNSVFTGGQLDASGRYFYGVTRWSPAVFRLDTATGDVTATTPYEVATANSPCFTIADDGYAYTVIATGAHRRGSASSIVLAKLDPVTMTTVATTVLTPPAATKVHACARHGTTFAIGSEKAVYLANLATMAFTDADTSTPDVIDPIPVGNRVVQRLVFSPDGAKLYVANQRSSEIDVIDTATRAESVYVTATDRVLGLTVDAAGALWWGQPSGLYSYDGTAIVPVPSFTDEVDAIGPWNGHTVAVAGRQNGTLLTVDVTDGTTTRAGSLNGSHLGHEYIAFPTP